MLYFLTRLVKAWFAVCDVCFRDVTEHTEQAKLPVETPTPSDKVQKAQKKAIDTLYLILNSKIISVIRDSLLI